MPKLILLLAIGAFGVFFIIIRPRPDSATFWLILIPGVACATANTLISRREDAVDIAKFNAWQGRLKEMVDIYDFEDDGHLNELFSDSEWDAIFHELESTPKGSRSLRRAIETIKPEIENED